MIGIFDMNVMSANIYGKNLVLHLELAILVDE